MMARIALLYHFLLLLVPAAAGARPGADEGPLQRLAFGSCMRQGEPQPIWDAILASRPGLFIFLGDNIYADTEDMTLMRARYARLGAEPGYRRLRAHCPVLATWDDHDYGRNDAGAEYPRRADSKRLFLEFFEVPESSVRWRRAGIYDAAIFGPPGRRIQIILLDTRSFRSPLRLESEPGRCRGGRYGPNRDPRATLLGAEQWQWLATELRRSAEVRIIGSSIQVIPDEHCFEKWGNLPLERARLLRLIASTRANGVILLSGDRHLAEISRLSAPQLPYPLYEVTSSGLNSAGAGRGEPNRHRTTGDNFRGDNFGLIRVDWARADPRIRLEVRDRRGAVALAQEIDLSTLQVPAVASPPPPRPPAAVRNAH